MIFPAVVLAYSMTNSDATFERIEIDRDFPGCYQVEAVDIDGDGKLDIVALGGGTVAWYQNPTWRKRIISSSDQTPGVISSASADIDGDGKCETAIAFDFEMNQPKRGKLALARQGETPDDPWTLEPIGAQPSTHRLRFGGFDSRRKPSVLIASPIFGANCLPPRFDQGPARIEVFAIDAERPATRWERVVAAERPVTHSLEVLDIDRGSGAASPWILTADNLGTALVYPSKATGGSSPRWNVRQIADGSEGDSPKRGSSEVHLGRLADGRRFLSTINPWHGHQVSIRYAQGSPAEFRLESARFGPREVLDDTLDDGHALCVADVDRDGDDEIFAGHRGKDHRLSMFKYDRSKKSWVRTVIDDSIAAQDVRAADFNGDGRIDIVSVGGKTHNVVMYRTKIGKR